MQRHKLLDDFGRQLFKQVVLSVGRDVLARRVRRIENQRHSIEIVGFWHKVEFNLRLREVIALHRLDH